MSTEQAKEWLYGLTEHMYLMSGKFSSQTSYAESTGLTSTYVSLILGRNYGSISRSMIIEIAYKANYDRPRLDSIKKLLFEIPDREWRIFKKETAVQYQNNRSRERTDTPGRLGAIHQADVAENMKHFPPARLAKPQDEFLIDTYLRNKHCIGSGNSDIKRKMLDVLCNDLSQLTETDIC